MTKDDLRNWRVKMKWTQPQASSALNTPIGTYRHWEQGYSAVPGVVEVAAKYILDEELKARWA